MLLVFRIGERIEELGVAPWPAYIFWRTATRRLDQAGIGNARQRIDQAFDLDRVLPAVSEVIEVTQGLGARVLDDAGERRLARVERTVAPIRVGNPPADVERPDLEEMSVGPPESGLQRLVQTIEPDGKWNFETSQNLWFDVVERDLQASDG